MEKLNVFYEVYGMRRIIATQNIDGTYHVSIHDQCSTDGVENSVMADIPRADIKITAYQSMDDDETIFTLALSN
jgi:hypothetical protein